jgi:hypothetical protein
MPLETAFQVIFCERIMGGFGFLEKNHLFFARSTMPV